MISMNMSSITLTKPVNIHKQKTNKQKEDELVLTTRIYASQEVDLPTASSAYRRKTAFSSHGLSRLMSNVCRPYLTATIATIVSRMAYLKPKTSWTDAP